MIYAVWLDEEINSVGEERVARTDDGKHIRKNDGVKAQHDIAWKLCGYVFKKEYGIKLSECTIECNRWGKPGLKEYPDIHFSISHNKDMAVCIVSGDEVGIDVETIGRTCSESVRRRMLSDEEYQYLSEISEEAEKDRGFLKYWTLKESYGKALGTGLSYDYKSVIFEISNEGIMCNVPDYRLWQTVINKNDKEIIISVCRRQTEDFIENIEWVDLIGGEADET